MDELQVGSYSYKTRSKAITDTGASHMFIPNELFEGIVKELGGINMAEGRCI